MSSIAYACAQEVETGPFIFNGLQFIFECRQGLLDSSRSCPVRASCQIYSEFGLSDAPSDAPSVNSRVQVLLWPI